MGGKPTAGFQVHHNAGKGVEVFSLRPRGDLHGAVYPASLLRKHPSQRCGVLSVSDGGCGLGGWTGGDQTDNAMVEASPNLLRRQQ